MTTVTDNRTTGVTDGVDTLTTIEKLQFADGTVDLAYNLTGSGANETLQAGDQNDSISGGNGFDTIFGGLGNDILNGDGHDDLLFGEAGDDTLSGGWGADSLTGGAGADNLTGGTEADTFVYTAAADSAAGATTRDTITDFTPGSDVIQLDGLVKGTLTYITAGGVFTGNTTTPSANTEVRYDKTNGILEIDLDGDGAADMEIALTSVTLASTLASLDANTTFIQGTNTAPVLDLDKTVVTPEDGGQVALGIDAPTDSDSPALTIAVTGVPANGTIYMADGTTVVSTATVLSLTDLQGLKFTPGAVTANTSDSFTYTVSDGFNAAVPGTVTLTVNDTLATVNETITGGTGDDVLIGGAGNDQLTAGTGDDQLSGGLGDDSFIYQGGYDTFTGGAGTDTLNTGTVPIMGFDVYSTDLQVNFSSAGDYNFDGSIRLAGQYAGTGIETLTGVDLHNFNLGTQTFTISATIGANGTDLTNDVLRSVSTGSTIHGLGGNDWIVAEFSSAGADTFYGDAGRDVLVGGGGNDTLDGGADKDELLGQNGDDTLLGGGGGDLITGGAGNDIIIGGAGGDDLRGDDWNTSATDTATDIFRYTSNTDSTLATGTDYIADFAIGEDRIDFVGMAGISYHPNQTAWTFTTDMATTIADIEANAPANSIIFFVENGSDADGTWTDGLLYVKGSGTVTTGAAGDFAGTLIALGDITTPPPASNIGLASSVSGTETLTLTALDDIIIGGTGNDTITLSGIAEAGDTFDGGAGTTDTLILDANGNTISVTNTETITGGAGNDTIAFSGDGSISTGGGTDTLEIAAGNEVIGVELVVTAGTTAAPTEGNLVISYLDASDVTHTVTVTNHVTSPLAFIKTDTNFDNKLETFTVATAFDSSANTTNTVLAGTSGNDTLSGGTAKDYIFGNGGDDTIDGGTGTNILVGGAGNDTLTGGTRANNSDDFNIAVYDESTGGITATLSTTGTVTGNATVGTDTLQVIDKITGTDFADTFSVDVNWTGGQYTGTFNGTNITFVELEGGAGNDTITGNGNTRVSYENAAAGVTVTLTDTGSGTGQSTGTGTLDAGVGVDTFVSGVNRIEGSFSDDILTGANQLWESFRGLGGNDTIDGGLGTDRVDYANSGASVFVNLSAASVTLGGVTVAAGKANDGFNGIDTLSNIEEVRGSWTGDDILIAGAAGSKLLGEGGNDTLVGGAGDDVLIGGTGNDLIKTGNSNFNYGDWIETGTGTDTVDFGTGQGWYEVNYSDMSGPVSIDLTLASGQVAKGAAGIDGADTLLNVSTISSSGSGGLAFYGTSGADSYTGGTDTAAFTSFQGLGGNDTITGGSGTDRIDYNKSTAGVVVNLSGATETVSTTSVSAGTATDGLGGTDTLLGSIEQVRGSNQGDFFFGSNTVGETFRALGGNDYIDGGSGGGDWARYSSASASVIADLGSNNSQDAVIVADGFGGYDTLLNIENLRSGSGADQLFGDSNANELRAGSGNDILEGRGGGDTLKGESGADTFVYRAISDSTTGGVDTITDFSGAGGDKIDITALVQGTFSYLGATAFSVNTGNTQARFNDIGNQLQIDVDGSGTADMFINMTAVTVATLVSSYIIATSPITGTDGNTTTESLTGTAGNDLFVTTLGNDAITTGGGNDQLRIDTDIFLESAELVGTNLVFSVSDAAGNPYTTTITNHTTAPLAEVIFDADENGTLDTYQVATSFDVSTSVLDTVMAGTAASDTITGGYGDDILLGNGGIDTLNGGAGDDRLEGGLGADVINGGTNLNHGDTVTFHNASSAVIVDLSATANALVGSGTATGGDGIDTLIGIENIEGSSFGDTLTGDAGNNVIDGLEGVDWITGGSGADVLTGGTGADVFIYTSSLDSGIGVGRDIISDFDAGSGDGVTVADTIDLSSLITGTFTYLGLTDGSTNAFTGGSTGNTEARFNNSTKILEIDTDGDATVDMEIELSNTDGTVLDDTDFISSSQPV